MVKTPSRAEEDAVSRENPCCSETFKGIDGGNCVLWCLLVYNVNKRADVYTKAPESSRVRHACVEA